MNHDSEKEELAIVPERSRVSVAVNGFRAVLGAKWSRVILFSITVIFLLSNLTYHQNLNNNIAQSISFNNPLASSGSGFTEIISIYGDDSCDYVIITDDEFIDFGSEFDFGSFARYKTMMGIKTKVVSTQDIYNAYDDTYFDLINGVNSTRDNATRIREFLKDSMEVWGIAYGLLGGDADEYGIATVPTRYTSSYVPIPDWLGDGYAAYTFVTDFYFSDLNGTWQDLDSDGIYGENELDILDIDEDGIYGENESAGDFSAEIYIGRAPVDNASEVSNFVSKTINHEISIANDDSYLNKILLAGSRLLPNTTYGGNGSDYLEEIFYGTSRGGFTTQGFPAAYEPIKLYEEVTYWNDQDLKTTINEGIHIANIYAHGGPTAIHTFVPPQERFEVSDVDELTNQNEYFFGIAVSCNIGEFNYPLTSNFPQDSIVEHLLVKHDSLGAFAFISNSRVGIGPEFQNSTDTPGHLFIRMFYSLVFDEHIGGIEKAHTLAKERVINMPGKSINDFGMRFEFLQSNLLGDPTTFLTQSMNPIHQSTDPSTITEIQTETKTCPTETVTVPTITEIQTETKTCPTDTVTVSTIADTVINTVTHTTTEQGVGSTQTTPETKTENSPVPLIPIIIAVVILGVFRYRKNSR